jgi:hypothetical protein
MVEAEPNPTRKPKIESYGNIAELAGWGGLMVGD